MLKLLDEMKARLDREHKPDGYNIGINSGAAAGQTVMHLHIHLIPRYAGDMPDPRGGVRWIFPDKAAYWEKK
jgi:diadenosine tetraphosphate (Ap4A) HIT family hydrolase